MIVSLIVAVAENGVIGRAGSLPWRIPSEHKAFRRLTMGKPLVMGRKTFESIGRVLDGRDTIVVSRETDLGPNVFVRASIDEALALAEERAHVRGAAEIMVIGGGGVFAAVLPRADRIYLTRVHGSPEGDVFFPPLADDEWRAISTEAARQDAGDAFAWTLTTLERAAKGHSRP